MKKFPLYLSIFLILLSCSRDKAPNTILLMVDDLGWGDMEYRKDAYLCPNIDQLAEDGVRFTNSYAASPTCSPCRATVITGQHAARLRLVRHIPKENPDGRTGNEFHVLKGDPAQFPSRNWLPTEVTSYAEALKEEGYATGFVGKWHLGHEPYHPIHQGYDVQYGVSNFGQPASYYAPFFGKDSDTYKDVPEGTYLTDQLTQDALQFIEDNKDNTPFHLTVFYYSAHTPFKGREDLVEKLSSKITKKKNLQHAAMMMAVDESIGKIRNYLSETGLDKNTAIIFLGDQGSHFDNSPLRGGKAGGTALYEGGARIPLTITWPGELPQGSINSTPVSTVDLFPTLLEIAGGHHSKYKNLDGESLFGPAKKNQQIDRDEVYLYRSYEDQYAAIRSGDWKMIAYRSGKIELYNLKDDLSEKTDIHNDYPKVSRDFRSKLADWEKEMGVFEEPKSPPMGWNSWNWFGKKDINEKIVRDIIDAFVDEGLRDAGYEYIVIDGGWRDNKLGPNNELLPHPAKFPNGIKPLADYAHSKGMKLGLHTVPGHKDCGGDRVGAFGHEEVHIQQFVDWGIDYIKLDKCFFDGGWNEDLLKETYFKWHRLIKESGHDFLFSVCAYKYRDWYPEIADIARTTYDISCKKYRGANFDDTKQGFMSLADVNNKYAEFARNGYWNDLDILVIGDQGLTEEEQKVHFAIWCLSSSPLMLGNDPRNMEKLERELALNKECIAINQDPSEQGKLLIKNGDIEIWGKYLTDGSLAILMLNRNQTDIKQISVSLSELGFDGKVSVSNIFTGESLATDKGSISFETAPHQGWFLKISAKKKGNPKTTKSA